MTKAMKLSYIVYSFILAVNVDEFKGRSYARYDYNKGIA